ncbi:MAG: porin family protein [Alphaproteobacteria bacterium]|nr:porin family protein [Alphaproteobacteria bacterium]
MRFTLAPAALALCATIGTAAAAGSTYGTAYIGLRGSYVFTDDGSTTGTSGFNYIQSYDDGYATAAYLGWTLTHGIRFEAEGGFRSADIDSVLIVSGDAGLNYLPGDVVDVGADVQAATVMGNFYYDFDIFEGQFVPWVGVGAGAAHVEYEVTDPLGVFGGNDDAWIFAYQLMAGITFPVSDGISITASYHYFSTEDFDRTGATGEVFKTDLTQQSIDLGVQIHL